MSILQNSNAISAGGYDINNSLRFRSSASAYLSRTPASNGNRKTWTWSAWVKRGSLGSYQVLFGAGLNNGVNADELVSIYFTNSDQLGHYVNETGVADRNNYSTAVYRDPSAWYHIVAIYDSTQATAANRQRLFVNNVEITSWAATSYVSQNYQPSVNSTAYPHAIGKYGFNGTRYFDGYLTEVNFIDGQALTPSSFGETDTTTGVWKPKAYTGTYGTNGFYLKFSDIATTSGSNAGLGKDFSGNTNYWTTNNISVTSGSTYDAMTDSPTLTSDTISNYTTISPLISSTNSIQNGNLSVYRSTAGNGVYYMSYSPFVMTSGKWYFEMHVPTVATHGPWAVAGIFAYSYASTTSQANYPSYPSAPNFYGVAINASNDIVGIAYDADNGKLWLSRNGTWLSGNPSTNTSPSYSGLTITNNYLPGVYTYTNGLSSDGYHNFNFGQRPFAYTLPTGFNRLNTYNLPDSTIKKGNSYMDATLYTGTGSALTVTNTSSFKPDFVWIKGRSSAYNHGLFDSVRGALKVIQSSSTATEATETAGTSLTGFNSNGFALGTNGGTVSTNVSGQTFVGWQWQAGQGSTSNITVNQYGSTPSIASTVSVNTTAGFSVVTWANTSTNATIGHGLGVAPKMIIAKNRTGTADSWLVYHSALGATKFLRLESTAAEATNIVVWNNTAPTSTVFSIGTGLVTGNFVAYCWAEIAGYSKAFSYTGNGSADGPFVFCNFSPKFIMIKRTDSTSNWVMFDTSRSTYNLQQADLYANLSDAEATNAIIPDILSNGFKVRTSNATWNTNGGTWIGMAFASNPFKNSLAR